ncbi:MAG: hypothetical protein QS98_C0007G0019 [archaeon GW2011_AR3]|nr:MAG: hypothetical protein QS98_C0007G0019 [archaeon GW2011_AR3]MBS3108930.1 nucleotidyltransferase domain-containing protein [Candidatus Woesearchaeota archaeon]
MLRPTNKEKLLNVFFHDPIADGTGYRLRELSRIVGVAPTSIKIYLKELITEGLVVVKEERATKYPLYAANIENNDFTLRKKIHTLLSIHESGLMDYISEECMPNAVVLFGSTSLGEDTKQSDIDLFVMSEETNLNLKNYENKLGRKIHVFFSGNFGKLSKELKNNIANGIVLKGYLKIF